MNMKLGAEILEKRPSKSETYHVKTQLLIAIIISFFTTLFVSLIPERPLCKCHVKVVAIKISVATENANVGGPYFCVNEFCLMLVRAQN